MKWILVIWLILTFAGPLWILLTGKINLKADYRTASRDSALLAPIPGSTQDAVIQVYAARAFNWRGIMATHCWISVKPKGAPSYTVYQVVGWRNYHGLPALSITDDIPDRHWYNQKPTLLLNIQGIEAETLIPKIDAAARTYPYAGPYRLWPGPNSNSFPAYIAREVPELGLVLPSSAVGKDFLPSGKFFTQAPSGTGYQLSLFGVVGLLIAQKEGIEVNLFGLVYGIKFSPFRVLLPGI